MSVLPEIFALIVLISLFQPIASRVRRSANAWIVGWSFLFLHYAARLFLDSAGPRRSFAAFCVQATLPYATLCFLSAAANTSEEKRHGVDWALVLELAIPLSVQCALAALHAHSLMGETVVALTLMVPGAHLLFDRRRRVQPLLGLAVSSAVTGYTVLLCSNFAEPLPTADLLFLLLTVAVAVVYRANHKKNIRACVIAIFGLLGWGISYSAVDVLLRFRPQVHVPRSLMELPQYIFAAGVLLALIEQLLARVEHMAMHDPLTGLPNRRKFEEYIVAAMARAGAGDTPLAFLVIDVDDFKQINDTHGHHVGDELLRSLGIRLNWNIGPSDILARTGGDEFTAVLAGFSDVHHLRFVAGTMMSAASVPFAVDGQSIHFRISIGIAVAPYDASDISMLRKAADQAMYEAKNLGGSQLVLASETAALIDAG